MSCGQVITHLILMSHHRIVIQFIHPCSFRISPHLLIIRLGKSMETYLMIIYGYARSNQLMQCNCLKFSLAQNLPGLSNVGTSLLNLVKKKLFTLFVMLLYILYPLNNCSKLQYLLVIFYLLHQVL